MQSQPVNSICSIAIRKLRVPVHLGCTAEERLIAQPVDVDVMLIPHILPECFVTDNLDDSICYDKLCGHIKRLATQEEYKLVEYLAKTLHDELLAQTEQRMWCWIRLTKCQPPVDGLKSFQVILSNVPAEEMARCGSID